MHELASNGVVLDMNRINNERYTGSQSFQIITGANHELKIVMTLKNTENCKGICVKKDNDTVLTISLKPPSEFTSGDPRKWYTEKPKEYEIGKLSSGCETRKIKCRELSKVEKVDWSLSK